MRSSLEHIYGLVMGEGQEGGEFKAESGAYSLIQSARSISQQQKLLALTKQQNTNMINPCCAANNTDFFTEEDENLNRGSRFLMTDEQVTPLITEFEAAHTHQFGD